MSKAYDEDILKSIASFEEELKGYVRSSMFQPPVHPVRTHPARVIRRDYSTSKGHLTVMVDPILQSLEFYSKDGRQLGQPAIFDPKSAQLLTLLKNQVGVGLSMLPAELTDFREGLNDLPHEPFSSSSLHGVKPCDVIYPGFCAFDWGPDDSLYTAASHKLSSLF